MRSFESSTAVGFGKLFTLAFHFSLPLRYPIKEFGVITHSVHIVPFWLSGALATKVCVFHDLLPPESYQIVIFFAAHRLIKKKSWKGYFFTAAHKILHRGKKKAYILNLVSSHSTIFSGISCVYGLLVALPLRHTYSAGHVAYLMPTTHSARDAPTPPRWKGPRSPNRLYFGSIPSFPCGAFTLDCLRNQTNPPISRAFFRITTCLLLVHPH